MAGDAPHFYCHLHGGHFLPACPQCATVSDFIAFPTPEKTIRGLFTEEEYLRKHLLLVQEELRRVYKLKNEAEAKVEALTRRLEVFDDPTRRRP